MRIRYISWLAIGVAAAFLVVASATFSLPTIEWLAFAVGVGTLVVSLGLVYDSGNSYGQLLTALTVAAISAWTVVASLVFSLGTVQNLVLASGLAIGALAIVGMTEHEVEIEHVAHAHQEDPGEAHSRSLASAA